MGGGLESRCVCRVCGAVGSFSITDVSSIIDVASKPPEMKKLKIRGGKWYVIFTVSVKVGRDNRNKRKIQKISKEGAL